MPKYQPFSLLESWLLVIVLTSGVSISKINVYRKPNIFNGLLNNCRAFVC
jgi:hypothetical protein